MGKLPTIMILMMLMMVSLVAADVNIKAGEEYTLTSITQCYGDVEVNLRGESPVGGGEYTFLGCSEAGANAWRCPCVVEGPTDIKMQTKQNIANTYDVAIEYYIAEKLDETSSDPNSTIPTQNALTNDNNRRTIAVGNIAVSTPTQAAPEREAPPVNTENTGMAMVFVLLIAFIFIGVILMVWKWLYNSRENKIDEEQMNKTDALSFHNRSSTNGADNKRRMNFFDSTSNKHTQEQVPIHQQSAVIPPEYVPPQPEQSRYIGPAPKPPKPKEITDTDVNKFLEDL